MLKTKQNKKGLENMKRHPEFSSDFAECCPLVLYFAAHTACVRSWKLLKPPPGLLVVGHLKILLFV